MRMQLQRLPLMMSRKSVRGRMQSGCKGKVRGEMLMVMLDNETERSDTTGWVVNEEKNGR